MLYYAKGEDMKILVAEDMASVRMVFKDILVNHCQFPQKDIFFANDGNEAVAEYSKIKPDIVFLDILMPRLDGKGALRQIMKMDPNAYVLMCSSAIETIAECMYEGAIGYVAKPLTPDGVRKAIEKFKDR